MPVPTQPQNPVSTSCSEQVTHLQIDITQHLCPMTFVRTRLALDRLETGQILEIRLKGQEPTTNIPQTAREQGHTVLSQTENPDGTTTLLIRK